MSSVHSDHNADRIGMWLFIATEIVLFGGLFLMYSMYRFKNPIEFHTASLELSKVMGTVNTFILLTSSLAVALASLAIRKSQIKKTMVLLSSSVVLAIAFIIVKGFEWAAKFEHGLYPNSAILAGKPKGEMLYFGLYFAMTGLHAVHVLVGIGLLTFVLFQVKRNKITPHNPGFLVNSGLYWNLVELIWIFLFPLFYLIS